MVTRDLSPAKGASRAIGYTATRPTISPQKDTWSHCLLLYIATVAEKHAQHHAEATVSDVKEGATFASTTGLEAAVTA